MTKRKIRFLTEEEVYRELGITQEDLDAIDDVEFEDEDEEEDESHE